MEGIANICSKGLQAAVKGRGALQIVGRRSCYEGEGKGAYFAQGKGVGVLFRAWLYL